jgi:hypothetical protein
VRGQVVTPRDRIRLATTLTHSAVLGDPPSALKRCLPKGLRMHSNLLILSGI